MKSGFTKFGDKFSIFAMRVQEINLNVADNQTQNLNYNPHNPNLTNPGSNKFARDYDKKPIIIKDYKQNLSLFSALLTLALVASLS